MDASINLNSQSLQKKEDMPKTETAGTIAQAQPQPLFNQTSETAGTIASAASGSSSAQSSSQGGGGSFSAMA